ncbi:MAG: NADH-quinone oxidoreductase subunit NuoE [Deltaproteobacteria bacterium HGW-Deltaproteobacteria-14]|nr:MAG: NADH-quinone oxidoreductase subunit NuoE [Deltaproteobacteria bacterium HGW-Deltaproteobacteria-14]
MVATHDPSELDPIVARYPDRRREHLIPLLQEVQDHCGYLSHDAMITVASALGLPVSKVYGVATFYNQFRFEPRGKVHCQVCRGTACHVKGSAHVLDTLERSLGVSAGHTGKDGVYSVEVVACMGACGLAPVVTINDTVHALVTPDGAKRLARVAAKQEAHRDDD